MGNYAGVDWASEKHDVLVADEAGEELLAATFAHDEQGLRALCRTLVRLKVELVAIERPDGLLVERLLDAGLRVLRDASQPGRGGTRPVPRLRAGSPTGSTRSCCASWRGPIIIASGCSSPTATQTKALRALTRAREDLVHTRVGADATSCARSSSGSGPGRSACSRTWTARSRWRSWSATRAPPTRADWASSASRRSSSASATAGGKTPGAAAREAQTRARGPRRRSRARHARRHARARARRRAASRSSRRSRSSSGRSPTAIHAAPRRRDLPLAVPRLDLVVMRRRAARRDRRLPRPLPHPRRARRRRRPSRGRDRVRQTQDRARSAGAATIACASRSAPLADSTRHWHPWAQDRYAACPRPRPRPPPRAPHPRPRLVPHRLALLARPHPVRPRPPPRPATPHHRHHPNPVGPPARPRRHPADGRRRRHRHGGPQGRARSA